MSLLLAVREVFPCDGWVGGSNLILVPSVRRANWRVACVFIWSAETRVLPAQNTLSAFCGLWSWHWRSSSYCLWLSNIGLFQSQHLNSAAKGGSWIFINKVTAWKEQPVYLAQNICGGTSRFLSLPLESRLPTLCCTKQCVWFCAGVVNLPIWFRLGE